MIFHKHPEFSETHAIFSPSQPYWINYDKQKTIDYFDRSRAQEKGTRLHAMVAEMIRCYLLYGTPLPNTLSKKDTIGLYFHDACKYRMEPEVTVVYSDICYGHIDALSFDEKKRILRIHDLKTGINPAKFLQLEVYAAQFFAEYANDIQYGLQIPLESCAVELRIYQFDQCQIETPPVEFILNDITNSIREKHEWLAEELGRRGE